jgi:hypothetical protein
MNYHQLFTPVSTRLVNLFPNKSFVYIDLKPGSSGKGAFTDRDWLDRSLLNCGYRLVYPPNLNSINSENSRGYAIEQNSESYWEYFFPGLRNLHRRKSGILMGSLINGINFRLAGELILRKLDIAHDNKAHLLFFDEGNTWHYAGEEVQDPDYLAKIILNHAHRNSVFNDRSSTYKERPEGWNYLKHVFSKNRNQENETNDEGFSFDTDNSFFQDEDVIRTLRLIRETENQFGFYKILRYLLQQQIANNNPIPPLNPELEKWVKLNHKQKTPLLKDGDNTIDFHQLDLRVRLQPLDYAIYKLFWNYPQGIVLKDLGMYREELRNIYLGCSAAEDVERLHETIDNLLDPTDCNTRLNQSLSRIKAKFKAQTPEEFFGNYIIKGPRGGVYKIDFRSTDSQ